MAEITDKIKVYDDKGFHYEVEIKHTPHFGISFAYYQGRIIASREYGRIHEPIGDNDQDWERYEELLSEWKDAAITDLSPSCKEYFNNQYKK